ncbi:MAG: VOC family protein [Alphaproteobacteria bacterium]
MNERSRSARPRFHLAFPVHDLEAARHFYGKILGCTEGRASTHWVDFDFHGHQIVAHLVREPVVTDAISRVDGDAVPVRHFGLILEWSGWEALRDRLQEAGAHFLIQPRIRFEGEPGEQATMFVRDPSGNALEFKAFRDEGQIFAR